MSIVYPLVERSFKFNSCTLKGFFPSQTESTLCPEKLFWKKRHLLITLMLSETVMKSTARFWVQPSNFLESCNEFIAHEDYKKRQSDLYRRPVVSCGRCSCGDTDSVRV